MTRRPPAVRVRPAAAGVALLAIAVGASALLWAVKPLPNAHSYGLAVQAGVILLLVWAGWFMRPTTGRLRVVLPVVALAGAAVGAVRLRGLDPHAEVVRTYHSLFDALTRGADPYTCRCIIHVTPAGDRLGDFNYPPGEIWPYQAVHALTGHWDIVVMAATVAVLNAIAFAIVLAVTPPGRRLRSLALFPIVVIWELRTTIGVTMIVTAAILAVIVLRERAPRTWQRPVLWVLFGVGLVTKFAVIPLFAAWWWWTAASRWRAAPEGGRMRALAPSAPDALVPAAVAALLCLPAGPGEVVRSTLLFNARLGERDTLTTFYPNALSGLARWAGLGALYPFVAIAILGAAILLVARLPLLEGMLMVTTVFLLAVPTPEPQYVPLVALVMMAALAERDRLRPVVPDAPPRGWRPRAVVAESRRARHPVRMIP